jgi:Leucine-rich repeat (LRR) protein
MQVGLSDTAQFSLSSSLLAPNIEASVLLLPLHGYHQYQPRIATQALALEMVAGQDYLIPELIEMVQSFCLPKDLLALTSINKAAFATRFTNPRLTHLYLATAEQVKSFLHHCWETQQSAVFTHAIRIREDFQTIKELTLTLSDELPVEQATRLFTCLPNITALTIRLEGKQWVAYLGPLLNAARHLALTYLVIERGDDEPEEVEYSLPNELWQWPTLEELHLCALDNVCSISEDIGKLINLTELELSSSLVNEKLTALPESLGQLTKLRTLKIRDFTVLSKLPEAIGQLSALNYLNLSSLERITTLPAGVAQLNKLEVLELGDLNIDNPLEAINQLPALKSLSLFYTEMTVTLSVSVGHNKLESLTLMGAGINNIPEAISQLSALKFLSLCDLERITTLPAGVWKLNKLETLELKNLNIDHIPKGLGQLQSLKHLPLHALSPVKFSPMN